MIKQAVRKTLQLSGRKIWDLSPYSVQSALRPLFQYNKLKRAKAKIGDHNLLKMRSKRFTKEIDDYWMEYYGKRIDPTWHHIFANYTGVEDVRFIPQDVFATELHDIFNDESFRETTYKEKNMYDILFNSSEQPKTLFKKCRGKYFDNTNNEISKIEAESLLVADELDKIIKPSQSDGGARVRKIHVENKQANIDKKQKNLSEIEDVMSENNSANYTQNYIVQYKVNQHTILEEFHSNSLNTVRILTMRWNRRIHVLLNFIKFGNNGNIIDSGSVGSVFFGLDENGKPNDNLAVNISLDSFKEHPYTHKSFSDIGILPGYDKLVELVKFEHTKALHMDFAAWDVAIKNDETPCLIEINSNPFVPIHQICCKKPLFGEFTSDVLKYVKDSR